MKAEFEGIHPDEGTIHAWLDGELDAPDAARVEAHVATCGSCAERVAEARGLIAGASRVVGLLDERPVPLLRPTVLATTAAKRSPWRVTPMRSAIAALLLVAAGLTLTRDRIAMEFTPAVPTAAGRMADSAVLAVAEGKDAAATLAPSSSAPQVGRPTDSVFASAVAKRVAQDQPARGVGAAHGIAIPDAPPTPAANVPTLNAEPAREVSRGQMAAKLGAATADAAADKAKSSVAQVAAAATCYRITSTDTTRLWGGVVLPMEIALASTAAPSDSNGARLAITGVRGGGTIGSWSRLPGDRLSLSFRALGATTVAVLAPAGQRLAGTLSSRQSTLALSEVVVTGAASPVARSRADSLAPRAVAGRDVSLRRDSASARTAEERRLPVVATPIDCPQ